MTFVADFRHIRSRETLIAALGTDAVTFDAILAFDPPPPREPRPLDPKIVRVVEIPLFFRHDIVKRNRARGHRTVWEPALAKAEYKALGTRLDTFLRLTLPGFPHESAYGYRAGRNIRENAAPHAGHARLLCVDIQDFFGSIPTAGWLTCSVPPASIPRSRTCSPGSSPSEDHSRSDCRPVL